jgi:hypothetical protein
MTLKILLSLATCITQTCANKFIVWDSSLLARRGAKDKSGITPGPHHWSFSAVVVEIHRRGNGDHAGKVDFLKKGSRKDR